MRGRRSQELKSLDKDDWAATWIEQGNRHMAVAKAAEPADRAKAREAYLTAWRMYNFGGWPARDSAGKEASYWQSVDAFRNYARLQEPAAELVQIPFENSKIVGLLRLPSGRGPHPVVLLIGGLDQYKEFGSLTLDGPLMDRGIGYLALDMPGTGELPTKLEIGAERVYSKVIDFLSARAEIDPRASQSGEPRPAATGPRCWHRSNASASRLPSSLEHRSTIISMQSGRENLSERRNMRLV